MDNFIQQLLDLQTLENSVLGIEKQRELCAKNLEALQELKRKAEAALTEAEADLLAKMFLA